MPPKVAPLIDHLLLRATKQGKLEWRFLHETTASVEHGVLREGHVGVPLVAFWKGSTFRLYEYTGRFYNDEDQFDVVPLVALELVVSYGGDKLSDIPAQQYGWELLNAARQQAAKLDGLAALLRAELDDDDE